jgi:hypothetical protein
MQQAPSPRHETAPPRGRRRWGAGRRQRRRPPSPIDRRTPADRLLPTDTTHVPNRPDMPGRPHPHLRPRQAQARRGRSWQWRSRQGPHDARPTVSRRPGWPASQRRVLDEPAMPGWALNDRARPLNAPGGVTTTALNDEEADRCDVCRSTGATTPAGLVSGDERASTRTRPCVRMTARPWSRMRHRG